MAAPSSSVRGTEAAVVALVSADSTFLARCPGGIGSREDENQTYPFVLAGDGTIERPWNTLGGAAAGHGRDVMLRLHVYSRYKGDREAWLIAERLVELLDFASLSVTGYQTVLIEYVNAKALIEDRNKLETRHIAIDFRVRVHQ
jgi:hypothetical protein